MTAVERAEAKVNLLKDAEAIAEQLRANEAEHDDLMARRTAKCRDLRNTGASIDELQEVLGVGRSRVHQILRGTRT